MRNTSKKHEKASFFLGRMRICDCTISRIMAEKALTELENSENDEWTKSLSAALQTNRLQMTPNGRFQDVIETPYVVPCEGTAEKDPLWVSIKRVSAKKVRRSAHKGLLLQNLL